MDGGGGGFATGSSSAMGSLEMANKIKIEFTRIQFVFVSWI